MSTFATIALIAICVTAAVEMTVIWVRCWSDGDAIRADEHHLTVPLAEERHDITGPELLPDNVEAIHIGHASDTDRKAAGDEILAVARIAESMEPVGSPWRVSPDSAVGISQAARVADATRGSYRPRHSTEAGVLRVQFAAIVERLGSEDTTDIGVRAA